MALNNKKILIVDDDPRICRVIQRMADQLGVESYSLNSPEHYQDFQLKIKPDIVFLDLQMPQVDGVELLRKFAEQHSKTSIILISGMDENIIETAMELGRTLDLNMLGYLNKPFEFNDVKQLLDLIVEPEKNPQQQV